MADEGTQRESPRKILVQRKLDRKGREAKGRMKSKMTGQLCKLIEATKKMVVNSINVLLHPPSTLLGWRELKL